MLHNAATPNIELDDLASQASDAALLQKSRKRVILDYFSHNYLKVIKILLLTILILLIIITTLFIMTIRRIDVPQANVTTVIPPNATDVPTTAYPDKVRCSSVHCTNESCTPLHFDYLAAKHLSCCDCMPQFRLVRYEYDVTDDVQALILEPLFDIDYNATLDVKFLAKLSVPGEWHVVLNSDDRKYLKYVVYIQNSSHEH